MMASKAPPFRYLLIPEAARSSACHRERWRSTGSMEPACDIENEPAASSTRFLIRRIEQIRIFVSAHPIADPAGNTWSL